MENQKIKNSILKLIQFLRSFFFRICYVRGITPNKTKQTNKPTNKKVTGSNEEQPREDGNLVRRQEKDLFASHSPSYTHSFATSLPHSRRLSASADGDGSAMSKNGEEERGGIGNGNDNGGGGSNNHFITKLRRVLERM